MNRKEPVMQEITGSFCVHRLNAIVHGVLANFDEKRRKTLKNAVFSRKPPKNTV